MTDNSAQILSSWWTGTEGGRRYHLTPRGHKEWESDERTLERPIRNDPRASNLLVRIFCGFGEHKCDRELGRVYAGPGASITVRIVTRRPRALVPPWADDYESRQHDFSETTIALADVADSVFFHALCDRRHLVRDLDFSMRWINGPSLLAALRQANRTARHVKAFAEDRVS